ncbi:MAG: hypothetical protein LBT59_02985 [Clostridiales bacterium]|nr:hypothetical protein [Clostridiales bacterium]
MNGQDDFTSASPPPPPPESEPGALSQTEWCIILFLQIIPCVNVVMMLMWAFSSRGNPTRKRVAQAWLIISACLLILIVIFIYSGAYSHFITLSH